MAPHRKIIDRVRELNGAAKTRLLTPREAGLDERDRLYRQIRRLSEAKERAFDQGFASCLAMVKAGATLERLEEASGAVYFEWSDTEPVDMRVPQPLAEADTVPVDVHIVHTEEFESFEVVHDTDVDG